MRVNHEMGGLLHDFGVTFITLGSPLEHFGCIFHVKKETGVPKVPLEATPPEFLTHLTTFWRSLFIYVCAFLMQEICTGCT